MRILYAYEFLNDGGAKLSMPDSTILPAKPTIGLALGSGVARGWAHLGVIRALERYGFVPRVVAGTSIGALVGGSYLAGHLDSLEEWARGLNKVRIISYLDFRVRGGMIRGQVLVDAMERHMGGLKIEGLGRPYAAIATDLLTGHEVWLRKGDLVKAIRTSFSLPGIFEPVHVDGRWLVDGALVNPVPVSACRAMGAQMTIGVNLNADLIGKARRPGTDFQSIAGFDLLDELRDNGPAGPGSKLSGFGRRIFKRQASSPSLFGVMVSALNIVQDRITRSRLAGEPPDVHIAPRVGHIGLLEFDRADEIIAEGEAAVERVLPDLRAAYSLFGHDIAASGINGK